MQIELYVSGKSAIAGRDDVLKLSANENPLGAPPSATAALVAAAQGVHRYPSTDHAELRAAIGAVHQARPIGSSAASARTVLQFVTQAFGGPG
ncbi:MAG: hypothetical protein R3D85_16545 [Paracoccaceae bacterium]